MAARDDSVIRGSLIACLIFLVLSLALNFFLYQWGSTSSQTEEAAKSQLSSAQGELQNMQSQATMMKSMLGVGNLTDAQREMLATSVTGDADMDTISQEFVRNMSYFGDEVDPQSQNYPALPEYLVNAIRSRNVQYSQAREEATSIRNQADAEVEIARKAQAQAETDKDKANKKLEEEQSKFSEDREQMQIASAENRDSLLRTSQELNGVRKKLQTEMATFQKREDTLLSTINTQLIELQKLRSDNFESTQGQIAYVVRDGNVVNINLGSADALRPGVTFGVIDVDETRLQDAKVKATIQVTKILGQHRAEARVVARPEIRYPIIAGDQIYSPFWAPGRRVKIALGWNIDLDGDERPDTDSVASMVRAAGAEVASILQPDGSSEGEFDSSVRFLVLGEPPEATGEADTGEVVALSKAKTQAKELGVTVIPAWKLQAYLRTIDDSLTTPLGSAVRGKDFAPEPSDAAGSIPNNLPSIFRDNGEGMQQGNDILAP
ncbi:hypothetical protein [Allorhodopirellula solitaria]|uniref:Uncharacterized protein n=1 Tax=Allorhodopirellula solitaria TaxID=2527987 RepID=A0A5C5X9V1_9BACT|nr:hypothetical protein [Allorhodopirellula solitaria]TWT59181.1 hypothetical protein CA85_38770 [Allorhodopirellula solitaria]